MTHEQFWHGDVEMVRAYRKAHELKQKRENEQAWLNGLYIYEAIGCMAPVFNMNAKRGTKPKPYPTEPHDFTPPPKTESEKQSAEQAAYNEMQAKMNAFMTSFNKEFARKGGDSNGGE